MTSFDLYKKLVKYLPTCTVTIQEKPELSGQVITITEPSGEFYLAFLIDADSPTRNYKVYVETIRDSFSRKGIEV